MLRCEGRYQKSSVPKPLPRELEPTSGTARRRIVASVPGWKVPVMKFETPAHRYRREAAECALNAKKATNQADREAWQGLAEGWTRLAVGAAVNPRLNIPDAKQPAQRG